MPSLAKLFKGKDSSSKKQQQQQPFVHGTTPPIEKPRWTDAWVRTRVDPEEVAELLSGCTQELKSRGICLYSGNLNRITNPNCLVQPSIYLFYSYPSAPPRTLVLHGLSSATTSHPLMVGLLYAVGIFSTSCASLNQW